MIDFIRNQRACITAIHTRIKRLRSNSIAREDVKNEIVELVDVHFGIGRDVATQGGLLPELAEIDDLMRLLLEFTHRRTTRTKYLSTLKRIENCWRSIEVSSLNRENDAFPTSVDLAIPSLDCAAPRVFVGHGHSLQWLLLADFLKSRLHLKVEEFNSESAAGKPTQVRLAEMLNSSSFAFLVFTGEDEGRGPNSQPRLNVVHVTCTTSMYQLE